MGSATSPLGAKFLSLVAVFDPPPRGCQVRELNTSANGPSQCRGRGVGDVDPLSLRLTRRLCGGVWMGDKRRGPPVSDRAGDIASCGWLAPIPRRSARKHIHPACVLTPRGMDVVATAGGRSGSPEGRRGLGGPLLNKQANTRAQASWGLGSVPRERFARVPVAPRVQGGGGRGPLRSGGGQSQRG